MGRLSQVFQLKHKKFIVLFATVFILASIVSVQPWNQREVLESYDSESTQFSQLEIHVNVLVEKVDGTILQYHHAGTLTNSGKDFIEGKLGNPSFANATDYVIYISLSSDSSSPSASWTDIPGEITSGGLARAAGTYASLGVGNWEIEYEFTATATHNNVQLTACNWDSAANDGSAFSADTFTPVTLESDDKITVTWTKSASGS